MSSLSNDWGGDYSYLMHSIEGKLQSHILSSDKYITTENDKLNITRKRSRQSNESNISMSPDIAINNTNFYHSIHHDHASLESSSKSSELLKAFAEIDELKILNEHLRDKNKILNDDIKRNNDRFNHQLVFVESEVNRLTQLLSDKNEQYYDERKKWQARYRDLESQFEQYKTVCKPLNSNTNSSKSGLSMVSILSILLSITLTLLISYSKKA